MSFKLLLSYMEIGLGIALLIYSAWKLYWAAECYLTGGHTCSGEFHPVYWWMCFGVSLLVSGLALRYTGFKSWFGHFVLMYTVLVYVFIELAYSQQLDNLIKRAGIQP